MFFDDDSFVSVTDSSAGSPDARATGELTDKGRAAQLDQLERIKKILLVALSDRGVQRVEFVTAFSEPYDSSVWLGTSTDNERDALLDIPDLLELVHDAIQPSGLDLSLITEATAQSQETVDRAYEGNWFYALR